MKLKVTATITTITLVLVGLLLISPLFFGDYTDDANPQVMLAFIVTDSNECFRWCNDLSNILNENDLSATVFIQGKVAEQYPECVTVFSDKIDIGSLTFNNIDLTSISDYTLMLEEVRKGKEAVDAAGILYSRLFMAPNMRTDQNIYSLLTKNDILADFSYKNQYNLYLNNQFVKFPAVIYNATEIFPNSFLNNNNEQLKIILFDNQTSINEIADFISTSKNSEINFVNASEATGLNLTIRGH